MTTSFDPAQPARRGSSSALIVGLAGAATILVLLVVGLTFFGLAVAFPIAIPVAQAYHLPVSASDAAIVARFAPLWWAFAGLAIASFAAAAVVLVKVINFVSPAPRD